MNIEQVVNDYSPILHFHPDEGRFCCYPSDAEEIYLQFRHNWNEFQEDKSPNTIDPTAPCYFETWVDDDMIQLRYWFWYRYNDFPQAPFGLGKHIGDWEHVEVRLYNGTETTDAIWLLSNHLEAKIASLALRFGKKSPERPSLDEKHIHIWVALGSHANYPSPDSKPRCYGKLICDKIRGDGEVWNTKNGLKMIHETNFSQFIGRWGDEKSPRSPLNEYNNRWRNLPNFQPEVFSSK